MNEEEISTLVKAGYLPSFNKDYLFKVKSIILKNKLIHSAIFINKENKEVTFEGGNDFREELLNEVKSLIGGLKC